ncbi:hypothetical protein [Lederbergia lenta]|uniref:hypothetical protein n=1 Tax=Lederbergia lenta TaxID=1467 RepID=UPI002041B1B7|nr:hypothetical protein [Lederbergia lenta]MCM3111650.1 hypothetical protein [Lederbergia lenta]
MTTVKQLYKDAIEFEESTLAHYIVCLLHEGKITLDDNQRVLENVQPDDSKLTKMIKDNQLGFCKVNIYSLKSDQNYFVFIFASNQKNAVEYYKKRFRKIPLNCNELSLDHMMQIGNRYLTFRDLKREQKEFPCIVGFYKK